MTNPDITIASLMHIHEDSVFIIMHSVHNVGVKCVSMVTDHRDKEMHVMQPRKLPTVTTDHNMKMQSLGSPFTAPFGTNGRAGLSHDQEIRA